MIVFNDKGELVSSNAVLDGKSPTVPNGVLEFSRKNIAFGWIVILAISFGVVLFI